MSKVARSYSHGRSIPDLTFVISMAISMTSCTTGKRILELSFLPTYAVWSLTHTAIFFRLSSLKHDGMGWRLRCILGLFEFYMGRSAPLVPSPAISVGWRWRARTVCGRPCSVYHNTGWHRCSKFKLTIYTNGLHTIVRWTWPSIVEFPPIYLVFFVFLSKLTDFRYASVVREMRSAAFAAAAGYEKRRP